MKKIVSIAIALVGLQFGLSAQEVIKEPHVSEEKKSVVNLSPEANAQKDVEALHSNFTLNAEQKTKAYDFSLSYEKKLAEIKTKYSNDRDNQRKEFNSTKGEYRSNIKSILSAEQLEKFNTVYPDKQY